MVVFWSIWIFCTPSWLCGDLSLHKFGTLCAKENELVHNVQNPRGTKFLFSSCRPLIGLPWSWTTIPYFGWCMGSRSCYPWWAPLRAASGPRYEVDRLLLIIFTTLIWIFVFATCLSHCVTLSPRQNPLWLLIMNLITTFDPSLCCLPPYPALVGKNSRYAQRGCHCASLICNFPFAPRNAHGYI